MIKDKNFLLVISKFPPEYSGPGVRIPRLYSWLKDQDHEINLKILCNGIEYTRNKNYEHEGSKVRRITAGIFYQLFSFLPKKISDVLLYNVEFVKCFWHLTSSKSYKNIDFLHVAGHSGGTAAALLWARMRQVPVLMELVNASAAPYQKIFSLFKVTVPDNSKIAFLTSAQSKPFINKFQKKIWIKPNPVDTDKFSFSNDQGNKKEKMILSIAKFMPRKNQIFLIEVLKHLPESYRLVLAGPAINKGKFLKRDREYFETILNLIKKYNLSDRVEIIQEYIEPVEYMKQADVYLMPAWDEGLGTPMIEAIACGVPVVANAAEPAFQEWIEQNENGALENIDNPQAWADSIVAVAGFDSEKREKISLNVKNRAGQEKIFSEYEAVFLDLLKI